MIKNEIKQAFLDLLPHTEPVIGEPDAEAIEDEAADGAKKKKAAKKAEPPRTNGVVERDHAQHGYDIDVQLDPGDLLKAVTLLDRSGFFLETITGVDWIKEKQLEAIYDFSRYDFDLCRVVIRTRTPRDEPSIPTISKIYPGAGWHERETHDFFGIKFEGHPHLIPLLLPEDADFHPLLKDFKP